MNVLNRNMFKNRDSRNRLAQMGGILSSSPELQETAMTFANGGGADLPDYIINVPGLTAEGEYLRISSATLEKLNNAVPEVMANARMVSPVEMVISEGFSSLVANARPGDEVVGTRVNRLREQRATDRAAAPDLAPVPIPPDTAEISSPTASTQDNLASINGVDIETVRKTRESDAKRSEAALIESLAPNNAQGQPGGTLGKRYAESDDDLRMINSQRYIESLIKGDPFSGELSPSQTARNQETLRNTLRREEIAQQRADIAESGRIAQDAADTRKAFSVPLESGIAKAVPTEVDDAAERLIRAERLKVLKLQALNKMQEPTVTPAEELQSVTDGGSRAAPTPMPDVEAERLLQAERERVLKLQALNKMQEPTVSSAEELQGSGEEGSIFETAGDYITEFFLNPEIQGKINSAIEQSQAATAKAVQKRVGKAIASSEDAVQALGNEAAIAAMDARNEAGPYRIAGKGFTGDGSEVDVKIEADSEGAGTVSADPLKPAVPIAKTATEVGGAILGFGDDVLGDNPDYSGQVESGTAKESSTRPPSFRRNADGVLITDDTQDSAEDLLKELSAERATNEQDQRQVEMEEEGDRKVVSPPVTPTITPAIKEKITTSGAEAGLGQGFGGDGSIGDLTKDYVKLLKSLLGESDEDKAARKGELFMLMGAALMSGKSSNALTNIGGALQIGAKAAIQDRTTRKKRDDTIGLKGFELAADRIAKRDAAQLDLDKEGRAKQTQLDLIDARLSANKNLASYREKLKLIGYTTMGEHKGLNSIYDLAEKGYADVAFDKPKDITLLELFELEARKANYTQEQINRYNLYYGRTGSGATDGGQEDSGDFKI